MTPTEALQVAITRAGSKAALCRMLTEHMPAREKPVVGANLYMWLKNGTPADYCPVIEKVTGVRCEDLRPGTDWAQVRNGGNSPLTAEPALATVKKRPWFDWKTLFHG